MQELVAIIGIGVVLFIQNYNQRRNIVADIEKNIDLKFDKLFTFLNLKFEAVDRGFMDMEKRMDDRFERIEKKLDRNDDHLKIVDTQIHELQTKTCVLEARLDEIRKVG